ncbi:MAG: phenylalanine ammonia-lyase [Deltaproteobacteria bacterium RIFOXYA12_FULL_61_11]|nr:MAG: phenylalanine ammonia-lyase [Deltaproteobacteria bacterium RIFOXYA12_FULL_61_11]
MELMVSGSGLTVHDVEMVARGSVTVRLSAEAEARISSCREMLERKLQHGEIMYGVNTGIGELAEVVLDARQLEDFQKYLIFNHAAGIGEPFPVEIVRAAMLGRINVHAKGHSGGRPAITRMLCAMLSAEVTPVVCSKGSVGACGDLAPMSQIALAVMGEGEVFYKGQRLPAGEGLRRAGLQPEVLRPRDGLCLINGSNVILGIGCLAICDIERVLKEAEIAAAMSIEALIGNMKPFDLRLHRLRGFPGAVVSASNLRRCFEDGDLLSGRHKVRVQDAYSMRSTPQVIGAARDTLRHAREQLEIELNGVCDNPIFLPAEDTVLTGANFQGTPISLPLDVLGSTVAMVCVLSERRLNRLLNPALSQGLPSFLTKGAGMFSGLMLSQYTSGMLTVEQKLLSTPAYIQSVPAAADQEDFVSMGMNSALKTRQILENACGVLGIELLAAAQGVDFRDYRMGRGTRAAHAAVREVVAHLDEDRPLFRDHNAIMQAMARHQILDAVERELGPLASYPQDLG